MGGCVDGVTSLQGGTRVVGSGVGVPNGFMSSSLWFPCFTVQAIPGAAAAMSLQRWPSGHKWWRPPLLIPLLLLCAAAFTLPLIHAESDTAWTAHITGYGFPNPVIINSSTAAPLTIVRTNNTAPRAINGADNTTLTYFLAGQSCTTVDAGGNPGTLGGMTDGSLPKGRIYAVSWIGTDSNLYIFGQKISSPA
jgi:hypothetical protein